MKRIISQKLLSNSTYIKYFLSYLLILTLLVMGFFFILRSQLTAHYFTLRSQYASIQLADLSDQLSSDILYLSQLANVIRNDYDLQTSRSSYNSGKRHNAIWELKEYTTSTKLLQNIIYLPNQSDAPLTTDYRATYDNDVFHVFYDAVQPFSLNVRPYLDTSSSHLIVISETNTPLLLYFPQTSSKDTCIYFFMLDINVMTQELRSLVSDELTSIVLIDNDRQPITGINTDIIRPYMNSAQLQNGIYRLDSATSLCVHTDKQGQYSILATLSNDYITRQVNDVFFSSYLLLLVLAIAGFFLILLAMRLTYVPLHKLTQKFVVNPDSKKSYEKQLDSAFQDAEQQRELIQNKLENYRLSMEQSLLDTMVSLQHIDSSLLHPLMDRLFDQNPQKKICIVRAASNNPDTLSAKVILDAFYSLLPDDISCTQLNTLDNNIFFLIIDATNYPDKEIRIKEVIRKIHAEYDYLFAISNISSSPMNLPSLYEETFYAANYWPLIPIVELSLLPPAPTSYTYPQEQLDYLAELLAGCNFSATRILINDIFRLLHNHVNKSNIKSFFEHSILVDILTILVNQMNQAHIDFNSYSDLYFETLFYCRSCSYTEKEQVISGNINKLLDIYEEKISEKQLLSESLKNTMEEMYCLPNFSIYTMADKFHVSVSHMSHLFRKELGTNFSDLLWEMRLEKTKELLLTTDMNINEICIAVGYSNTSSFGRKFKLETGMTPLQYKEAAAK